jgi:hypothetical protein
MTASTVAVVSWQRRGRLGGSAAADRGRDGSGRRVRSDFFFVLLVLSGNLILRNALH